MKIIKISRSWETKNNISLFHFAQLVIVGQKDICSRIVGVHRALNGPTGEARYVRARDGSIVGIEPDAQSVPAKVGQGLDDGGGDAAAGEGDEATEEEDEGGADDEAHLACLLLASLGTVK